MRGVIYLLTNNINQKQYVGKTRNLQQRMQSYGTPSENDRTPIANAMRIQGANNFTYTVLREGEMTDEQLASWESYYIEQCGTLEPSGYNVQR